MIGQIEKSSCNGCSACYSVCPQNCISMRSDKEGFWYPQIEGQNCIKCGLCEKVCPLTHKEKAREWQPVTAYAAYVKNEELRAKSSSGGMFSVLAEWALQRGGIVYGAGFDEKLDVVHQSITEVEQLEQLRGSKYVQSRIDDAYIRIKKQLDSGMLVLFTGTPCQIGGLKSFLGKDYEKLVCQDVICHGIPSPMVWRRYIQYREKKVHSTTQRIFFRNKEYGWKEFSMKFDFTNDTEYIGKISEDNYMQCFLSDYSLRPSCYNCAFKYPPGYRRADFTLADFWGLEKVLPDMDDNKGTSLVFVNTEKGQKIFDHIKELLNYQRVEPEKAIIDNPSMAVSAACPKKRDEFFRDIQAGRFDRIVHLYCGENMIARIKKYVYTRLSWIRHNIRII